jgi:hemolysin III
MVADWIVHAAGIACGSVGGIALLAMAANSDDRGQLAAVGVYVAGLLAMLVCSALYHVWRSPGRRDWLRRLDHAAIFVMIAGTYTPIAVLAVERPWHTVILAAVWAVALAGVVLKLVQPKAIESISVALYLLQGWIGLFVLDELVASVPARALVMVLLGALVYSGGVAFHLSSRRYSLALWHGCVLVGAAFHYMAVVSLLQLTPQAP